MPCPHLTSSFSFAVAVLPDWVTIRDMDCVVLNPGGAGRPIDQDENDAETLRAGLENKTIQDPTGLLHCRLGDAYMNSGGQWNGAGDRYVPYALGAYNTAIERGVRLASLAWTDISGRHIQARADHLHIGCIDWLMTQPNCYTGHFWRARLLMEEGRYIDALNTLNNAPLTTNNTRPPRAQWLHDYLTKIVNHIRAERQAAIDAQIAADRDRQYRAYLQAEHARQQSQSSMMVRCLYTFIRLYPSLHVLHCYNYLLRHHLHTDSSLLFLLVFYIFLIFT